MRNRADFSHPQNNYTTISPDGNGDHAVAAPNSQKNIVVNLELRRARILRKKMTPEEQLLWNYLRNRKFAGFKWRRHQPIGRYIVDFVCLNPKVIVDLEDNGNNESPIVAADETRSDWLRTQGFVILRYGNHQIREEWDAVAKNIYQTLLNAQSANGSES